MGGWRHVKIMDVIEPLTTVAPRKRPDDTFEYIDVSSVSRNTSSIQGTSTLCGRDAPSRARRLVHTGDVLFATIRPTLQRIALVPDYLDGSVCSTGFFVLRPKAEVLGRFLFHYLFGQPFSDEMALLQRGASYPAVSDRDVKAHVMSLPSLAEQERIVAILDEAFAAIATATANAERNLTNARELSENYVNRVFAQKHSGWKKTALGNVAAFKNGLNFTKNSTGEIVKIVGVRNFQSNHWVPMDELDAVQIEGALSEPYTLRKHDILTVRSNGNRQLIGRCILVGDAPEKVSYSGFTIRIRVHSSDLDPMYLIHYLRSGVVREKLVKSGGGTNISNLNQKGLSVLAVRMPDRDEQSEIVMRVEAVTAEIERLALSYQAKASSLAELKQSILHKAFTGELTADFSAADVALSKGEV